MNRYTLILLSLIGIQMSCRNTGKQQHPYSPDTASFTGYPVLPATARELSGFIPDGWELQDSCVGDLNRDGVPDLVFVLQSKDTLSSEYSYSADTQYPRLLGIAFREEENNAFRLVEQSHRFLPAHEANRKDPEMRIRENGTLFFRFTGQDDWERYSSAYIFRHQQENFYLIGQELSTCHWSTTRESTRISINYSTGKAIRTYKENDHADVNQWEIAVSFTVDRPLILQTVGLAGFHPEIDIDFDTEATSGEKEFEGYPTLPATSTDLQGFIPDRWHLLESAEGDLNQDGIPDIAFVLQSKDSIPAEDTEGFRSKPWYPRILGIAFRDPDTGHYKLVEQSDHFVITDEGDATMDEPFEEMTIRDNGTLRLGFRYWYSAGTWYMGGSAYIFRYQNHRFELIGQDIWSMHRATHESSHTSINYSTGKAVVTHRPDGDSPEESHTLSFQCEELPTLRSVGQAGFTPEIDLSAP
ncbi:MAG: hypothetical protein LIP08_06710 [Bacteroides sp.]|nr:hypothetical protein [Bacteroides sp.]